MGSRGFTWKFCWIASCRESSGEYSSPAGRRRGRQIKINFRDYIFHFPPSPHALHPLWQCLMHWLYWLRTALQGWLNVVHSHQLPVCLSVSVRACLCLMLDRSSQSLLCLAPIRFKRAGRTDHSPLFDPQTMRQGASFWARILFTHVYLCRWALTALGVFS